MLFDADTLAADFQGMEILDLTEAAPVLDEGPLHQGEARTTRMVARRPL